MLYDLDQIIFASHCSALSKTAPCIVM